MAQILIVDDEYSILESMEMFLGEKGHTVHKAETAEEGCSLFHRVKPEVVILDIRLPDGNGLDVLAELQRLVPSTKVIMITAFQDMETTIEAMKRGAYDYIHKPLNADEVEKAVNRALHILEVDRKTPLQDELITPPERDIIIGKSEKMREIFKMIGLLCQNKTTVLIQGETGTGKELIARVIHSNSLFNNEPFVTMDCSAVVESLVESELFGHEKGAFTNATYTKQGMIELAESGTLFLDEIGELPYSVQGNFLGFLQRREYMRVGGHQPFQSRCRIIAATNRDLTALVKEGKFREDLYFRLRVVNIQVPQLKERLSDIPDLVSHFLKKLNVELQTEVTKLQPGVMERLMRHPWEGNVRELENVLVEAVVRARSKVILLEEIEGILSKNGSPQPPTARGDSLLSVEKEHIENTLFQVGWNRTKASQILSISLPTLRSKIRKYGITPPS